MGPLSRVAQFKQIESTYGTGDLQQLRWSPSLIADTPAAALARLYMLPGAHYNDPESAGSIQLRRRRWVLFRAAGLVRNLKATCLWGGPHVPGRRISVPVQADA